MVFVIWQPRGLSIGWPAAVGALLALMFGIVNWVDVWTVGGIVWNATLTFVALIVISVILDEVGFFEWSALHMARLARGDGKRMFLYMLALGAAVSAFFANDGAALILTPIMLAQVRALQMDERRVLAFVMAGGFIADTTSLPLIVSNLTNIVTADYFGIGFVEYASRMVVPNLVSFVASLLMIVLVYRRSIPEAYRPADLKKPSEAIRDVKLFRLSWWIIAVLFGAYLSSEWLPVPVCLLVGAAAAVFLAAASGSSAVHAGKVLREAPWTIVIFSIGMYVVVYGLRNAGLTEQLSLLIEWFAGQGLYVAALGMGYLSAILSSGMNNLPTLLVGTLAIDETQTDGLMREMLIYANVIGSNLGPKMTPIGSLATLIWLHVLARKGVRITWGYYFKIGVLLTVPTLLLTLTGLYVWLKWLL